MKANIFIPIIILVLMAAVFVTALFFPFRQAKLVPLTVSGLVFILAAVQLVSAFRSGKYAGEMTTTGEKKANGNDLIRYFIEITWMAGFLVGIYALGFLSAIFLFGIAYMKLHSAKWTTAILAAAFLTILSWGIFSLLLGVKLYPGVMFKLFKLS